MSSVNRNKISTLLKAIYLFDMALNNYVSLFHHSNDVYITFTVIFKIFVSVLRRTLVN